MGWGISTQGRSNDPARMVAEIGKAGFFSRLPFIGNAQEISEAATLAQQLVTEGTAYAQKHLAEHGPDRAPDRAARRRMEDLLAHPLDSAPRVTSLDRAIERETAALASPEGLQEAFRQRQMEEANSGKAPSVIRPDSRLGRALDELRYSIGYLQTTAPGVWRELQKTDTASMRAISAIADSSSLDPIPLALSTPNFASKLREETASVRETHAEQKTNLESLRAQQAETHAARQKFQEAALDAEDTALQAVETLSTTASSKADVDHWLGALQKQIQAILDKHPVQSAKKDRAANDTVPFMRVFQGIGAQR